MTTIFFWLGIAYLSGVIAGFFALLRDTFSYEDSRKLWFQNWEDFGIFMALAWPVLAVIFIMAWAYPLMWLLDQIQKRNDKKRFR